MKAIRTESPANCTDMLPIQKLLSRLRWDPRYRRGRFELGYYDRMKRSIVTVPFDIIYFPVGAPGTFEIQDEEAIVHRIPFHRVRRVYRDGRCIWERNPPGDAPGVNPAAIRRRAGKPGA